MKVDNLINFGIIGCSTIAENSTIPAILKSSEAKVLHIGSRSRNKAEKIANKFDCSKYGTYEEVLDDKDVDCVYISTPVGTHAEWVEKAAKSGKHILCEKSSTTSYKSAKKMCDVCRKYNVRLMEGFMYRFHPSHEKIKEVINNKIIGKPFSFYSRYGFPPIPKENIRFNKTLGGGILNDAGCYPINASRMLFNLEPRKVFCKLLIDEDNQVDTTAIMLMEFDHEVFSQSTVSYNVFYQSIYSIWGTQGNVQLERAYNVPPNMKVKLKLSSSITNEEIFIEPVDHFKLMIDSFSREIKNRNSCPYNFEKDLLNQARVMEAMRKSNFEKRWVDITEINL